MINLQNLLDDVDLPAVGVGVDGLGLGRAIGGEEEEFAVVQTQRRQVDETTPHGAPTRQPMVYGSKLTWNR